MPKLIVIHAGGYIQFGKHYPAGEHELTADEFEQMADSPAVLTDLDRGLIDLNEVLNEPKRGRAKKAKALEVVADIDEPDEPFNEGSFDDSLEPEEVGDEPNK